MDDSFFAVYPYYRAPLVQRWVLQAQDEESALEDYETGTFVSEEVKEGGELVKELSDVDEISPAQARNLRQQRYTVVGFSANHPNGFTRVVTAESPKGARLKFNDPNETVLAVLEGKCKNLL